MHNEQIHEAFWKYLKNAFQYPTGEELPLEFRDSYCITCTYWFLINEAGLYHLAVTSPNEHDEILRDLSGKRIETYREKGDIKDVYSTHRFYGWCKRFPPSQRNSYSVIRFRTIFSLINSNVPRNIAEYDFPLMPHDSSCGEWKEGPWVAEFISKHKWKAQPAGELDG